jgi:signal transduction histidine kinase
MVEMTSKHTAGLEETLSAAAGENEKLRSEIEKLKAEMTAGQKKRRDFDALVSVDLKTPLNAFINHLEAVRFNGPEIKDQCTARLNTLAEAVRNAYLDFHAAAIAGIGDGDDDGLIINRGRASFGAIVDRAVEYYQPVIEIKGLTIKKEIADELSAANIDAAKVGSAVNNLVSNAVKFSPAEQTVSINACFEGDSLFFSIADKGCGVSEDIQEKIFLSDFCVSMPGTFKESGFGTGLKLCKSLIEAHGGSFWFEPGRDGGSVFYFKVPAGRPPARQ